jgi:hypothetical protein
MKSPLELWADKLGAVFAAGAVAAVSVETLKSTAVQALWIAPAPSGLLGFLLNSHPISIIAGLAAALHTAKMLEFSFGRFRSPSNETKS